VRIRAPGAGPLNEGARRVDRIELSNEDATWFHLLWENEVKHEIRVEIGSA